MVPLSHGRWGGSIVPHDGALHDVAEGGVDGGSGGCGEDTWGEASECCEVSACYYFHCPPRSGFFPHGARRRLEEGVEWKVDELSCPLVWDVLTD